jgi:hypothetical protein
VEKRAYYLFFPWCVKLTSDESKAKDANQTLPSLRTSLDETSHSLGASEHIVRNGAPLVLSNEGRVLRPGDIRAPLRIYAGRKGLSSSQRRLIGLARKAGYEISVEEH